MNLCFYDIYKNFWSHNFQIMSFNYSREMDLSCRYAILRVLRPCFKFYSYNTWVFIAYNLYTTMEGSRECLTCFFYYPLLPSKCHLLLILWHHHLPINTNPNTAPPKFLQASKRKYLRNILKSVAKNPKTFPRFKQKLYQILIIF